MKKPLIETFKIFIIAMLALILWMPGYFIVRSLFPLDRPEFGGLSFWNLMKQRGEHFDEIAHKYEAFTGKEPKYGMCIKVEISLIITMAAPESMICGVMNTREDWRALFNNRSDMQSIGCGVIEASWITAPNVAWQVFENYLVTVLEGSQNLWVKYCRLGLDESIR